MAEYEKKRKAAKKSKGGGKPDVAGIAPDQIIESTKEAAKYARVSARTVRRWVQEGMYAGKRDGKRIYIKNVLDVYKLHHGKEFSEDRKREQTAEADYKEIKAKLLAMDLKVRTGELIEREAIDRQRVQRIQAVKRAFLGLGRKLAPQLGPIKDPRKIQARIDEQVREIIGIFAK
ncbi:MAG TPA: helix-turn-helix domain-containing protein [Sedimentisphaerales bacterium]|nr:helix-turn-helix domain-containing protein [Sedimentisphaerales bacterium]